MVLLVLSGIGTSKVFDVGCKKHVFSAMFAYFQW